MWSLLPSEELWRDRYDILRRNEFLLRSRFQPDWVPSWKNTNLNPFFCEDAFGAARPECIDATRIRDGVSVFIKRVIEDATEIDVQQYLSLGERKHDPENHSCPILEVFRDSEDEGYKYTILPILRDFNDPPFYAVVEVLDFMQQTLEGLKFMHDSKAAHCDCAEQNIMMDGTPLYPEGFHPAHHFKHPTIRRFARKKRRLHTSPVKYYFIDFDLSAMYNEEWDTDTRHWNGFNGHEQNAPEILGYRPGTSYNAYLLDVFILGGVYERSLLERYSNVGVLKPVVEGMTREDPRARITPEDAIVMLSTIRQSLDIFGLRGRLHLKSEKSKLQIFLNDMRALLRDINIPYVLKACFRTVF